MSDQNQANLGDQLQERLVDVRNELIMQAANAYLLVRSVALATVGVMALGKDEAGALLERSVERGEMVEADTQKMVEDYREHVRAQMHAADASRAELTEKATLALNENLKVISQVFFPVAGSRPTDKPAPSQATAAPDAGENA